MTILNLEIDGDKMRFEIPDCWADVTVETFSKIHKIDRENLTDIEAEVAAVSMMAGIDEDTLFLMTPEEYNTVGKIVEFVNEDVESSSVDSIMVGEDEYFLKKDFDKLTMGEIVSLNIIMEKTKGNIPEMMPEMLCIFLRKKKANGKLEGFKKSFMERAEMFKDIKITDVNSLFLFFSGGGISSINNTQDSSESQS